MIELTRETLFVLVCIVIICKGFILMGAYYFKEQNKFFDAIAEFYIASAPYVCFLFSRVMESKKILLIYAFLCLSIGAGVMIKSCI